MARNSKSPQDPTGGEYDEYHPEQYYDEMSRVDWNSQAVPAFLSQGISGNAQASQIIGQSGAQDPNVTTQSSGGYSQDPIFPYPDEYYFGDPLKTNAVPTGQPPPQQQQQPWEANRVLESTRSDILARLQRDRQWTAEGAIIDSAIKKQLRSVFVVYTRSSPYFSSETSTTSDVILHFVLRDAVLVKDASGKPGCYQDWFFLHKPGQPGEVDFRMEFHDRGLHSDYQHPDAIARFDFTEPWKRPVYIRTFLSFLLGANDPESTGTSMDTTGFGHFRLEADGRYTNDIHDSRDAISQWMVCFRQQGLVWGKESLKYTVPGNEGLKAQIKTLLGEKPKFHKLIALRIYSDNGGNFGADNTHLIRRGTFVNPETNEHYPQNARVYVYMTANLPYLKDTPAATPTAKSKKSAPGGSRGGGHGDKSRGHENKRQHRSSSHKK